ncbi:rhodanese-like domain-containing protein [Anaeromicropila herbilytica]|nr:rhodanese-like domain-containing protein [Anaeromicropila herbilytica]
MNIEYISVKSLEEYINNVNAIIIDLRDYSEYKKGHVPNAVNIELENLSRYRRKLDKYKDIVLYCDRGSISLLASRELSKLGYHVINVAGGFHYYKGKISTTTNLLVD